MQNMGGADPLPARGIRIVAPWLVIAPPGNAVIRLDLRLLDRVRLIANEYEGEPEDNDDSTVVLVCGEVNVALYVAEGPNAAARIVADAAPWTREQGGAARPLPQPSDDGGERPHGMLVVMSSTADGAPGANDPLAGATFELARPVTSIGRAGGNDIVLDHRSLSAKHASVTRDAATGRYSITDLNATNGVRVNGADRTEARLRDGDTVDLGHVRMRFSAPGDAADDWAAPQAPSADELLIVGNHAVLFRGDYIQVGSVAFRTEEVDEYSLAGANLPLPGGFLVQAAMVMLVVAAQTSGAPT